MRPVQRTRAAEPELEDSEGEDSPLLKRVWGDERGMMNRRDCARI